MTAQRLGLNQGRYAGETIPIDSVLREIHEAALTAGWSLEELPTNPPNSLQTWRRGPTNAARHIYISAGIHGDEPAGPLAMRQLLQENQWPSDIAFSLCPCLNPEGFRRNTRENEEGIDLNRDYLHLQTAAVRAHIAWLQRQPSFSVALCLHEDWESNGFYVYELNGGPAPSRAEEIVRQVAKVCPIDLAPEIEGRPANGGVIRPVSDPLSRPQWPEAFYLFQHKSRTSYTFEAPSDFPLAPRVAALVSAVRAAL